MDRTWSIKEAGERELVEKLAAEINVDEIIANLLVQRNIHSFEDARKFFRPTMEGLHDPFLMKDMDKSVQRIEKAISGGERIMIYGDYDVDGTTAVALMFYCLSPFSQELICYIPDRYGEGYGISVAGIERAAAENVSLIIALDCGIKAADKVDFAKEKDIDLIICDHHTPGELIPDACAILNPKQPDCKYPNKELTGCGIGFKLLQAFHLHNNKEFETRDYALQLAAISTACDIVPMTDENRYITHFGLEKINALPIPGVKVLIDASKRKRPLNVSDLVFVIGPRLNSAGRMAHGLRSVELLLAKDEAEAIAPGQLIESLNAERRKIDLGTQDAALNLISKDMEMQGMKSTVLYDPEWHQGVLGIVASRLMDHYYRPTVLLTGNNGLATGSARSVRDFDLYSAIESCSDLLERFGGHRYAAGLTLKVENIEAFGKRFEEAVQSSIEDEMLIPRLSIDHEIDFEDITFKFTHIISQFAPFGPKNMRPVFMTRNVLDTGYSKYADKFKEHLKLHVRQQNSNKTMDGIAFGMADKLGTLQNNLCDVAYCIEEREWKGVKSVQLKVKDIRPSEIG